MPPTFTGFLYGQNKWYHALACKFSHVLASPLTFLVNTANYIYYAIP